VVSRRERERIEREAEEKARNKARKKTARTPAGRLEERVHQARANVVTAMTAAARGGPAIRQLEQSVQDWKVEANRIDGEIQVVQQLTGDPQRLALKKLKARVEVLEDVANRIVETAFTDGLTPKSPELDRLQHATDNLEALELAYEELGAHPDEPGWKKSVDDLRSRVRLPDRFRK